MIYNDRTVRGVILARLSVMKKREKKGKFGCEQGRIWKGGGHGLQVRPQPFGD